jgi:hypothetical protein
MTLPATYTPVGSVVSGVPDPMYPAPEALIRRIRAEIDPHFVPLWVNKWWKTENGSLVKTGYHMIARHVRNPHFRAPVIKGLLLPTTKTYGIRYEAPILMALSMDGLSDDESIAGQLPRYEPFSNQTFNAMKKAMWLRNNKSADQESDDLGNAVKEAEAKVWQSVSEEADYRHKNDGLQFRKGYGTADSVYVSSTLVKLREAAGMESAA